MQLSESFVELRFEEAALIEDVQAVLTMFDPLGFLEEEEFWTATFTSGQWAEQGAEIAALLRERFPSLQFTKKVIEQENWNRLWEETIRPVRVSDRILIAPSWHVTEPPAGGMVLIIDPKMSFGTGYHATTRLVIRLLEKHVRGGERMLDIGTGTGILAIAARKLGAAYALGVDNDEWSYDNSVENVGRNGLTGVDILYGSLEAAHGTFGLIAANITKNDIVAMLPDILRFGTTDALFLFSGILAADRAEIEEEFALRGLRVRESLTEEEWIAYAASRRE
jgi:ribosomal protein L11 methyltransferase